MLGFLRRGKAERPSAGKRPVGRTPQGSRAYAIGDVHGELDALTDLLGKIEADCASRPSRRTFLVFLGDLIDRGISSRKVIDLLRTYDFGRIEPIFLAGNHEEIFLRILDGDQQMIAGWLDVGGHECALSYGVASLPLLQRDTLEILRQLIAKVPASHVAFLRSFGDSFRFGDYLFVHAGLRPGIPIEDQDPADLRWIREEFLRDRSPHGAIVVHGHTVVDAPEERVNRIGIDTGAYRTGCLTAICVEDDSYGFLATKATEAGACRAGAS